MAYYGVLFLMSRFAKKKYILMLFINAPVVQLYCWYFCSKAEVFVAIPSSFYRSSQKVGTDNRLNLSPAGNVPRPKWRLSCVSLNFSCVNFVLVWQSLISCTAELKFHPLSRILESASLVHAEEAGTYCLNGGRATLYKACTEDNHGPVSRHRAATDLSCDRS
jgi:hypothetical protein